MKMSEIETLRNQLVTARNEIQNLRKEVTKLSHVHWKDIQKIESTIENYKCPSCTNIDTTKPVANDTASGSGTTENLFKPIGVIRTVFTAGKRAVPRQPSINRLLGRIEISQNVFNNPEHSLEGLSSFSHLWIIYHFHRNESHAKAKVAPPRLGGSRVGIFSTRSPHRPCPIGLSLVEIDRVEDKFVYFYGTDMVDGTPVLDIKPYIPAYDCPGAVHPKTSDTTDDRRENPNDREEPDGEETFGAAANHLPTGPVNSSVKVPKWIDTPGTLTVTFTDRASEQLGELGLNRNDIEHILSQDPRSVYLRTKHGSQLFTFQIASVMVSCQFDDESANVTVVQILKAEQFDAEICSKDLNG